MLSIFILALLLHPECQERAQEEIDTVIGRDRLPGFSDRQSLPYLECLLQETHRCVHLFWA
jgi:cytochrome P450